MGEANMDEKASVIKEILFYIEEVERHLNEQRVRNGIPSVFKSLDKTKEQLRKKELKPLLEIKKSIQVYCEIMITLDTKINAAQALIRT